MKPWQFCHKWEQKMLGYENNRDGNKPSRNHSFVTVISMLRRFSIVKNVYFSSKTNKMIKNRSSTEENQGEIGGSHPRRRNFFARTHSVMELHLEVIRWWRNSSKSLRKRKEVDNARNTKEVQIYVLAHEPILYLVATWYYSSSSTASGTHMD